MNVTNLYSKKGVVEPDCFLLITEAAVGKNIYCDKTILTDKHYSTYEAY